jgi:RND family efflux transporter MFP subunit
MRSPSLPRTCLRRPPLLAAAVLAAVACASCSSPPETDGTKKSAVPVHVATVQAEPVAGGFEAGGTVRALTVAPLSSRIVSPILEIHVAPGDRVRRGQRLITLDARQLTATAATAGSTLNATMRGAGAAEADERAAQAALELAKASHARIASLRERNSATAGELDEAVAALRAAEARLDMVQARRAEVNDAITAARSGAESAQVTASYAVISAPFDGLVTESPAQAGAMATPGVPLIVVEDTRRYRLEASVDATRAGAVTVGSVVPVLVTGLDQVNGTVAEISESINPGAHTFIVKIDLPQAAGLRSGLFGRARFATAGTPGIAVPEEAVLRRGQLTLVFVEQDGVARMRLIHAGPTVDGRVRVLAGLEAGDRLIHNPPSTLLDGTPVAAQAGRQP